jgi:histone H3
MRYYQRTTHNLIPKSVFERVVREIARDIRPDIRFKKSAIADIQTVAEAELVKLFTNADKLTRHRKRKTLTRRDLTLVCDIIKSVCENSYHKGDQYR